MVVSSLTVQVIGNMERQTFGGFFFKEIFLKRCFSLISHWLLAAMIRFNNNYFITNAYTLIVNNFNVLRNFQTCHSISLHLH